MELGEILQVIRKRIWLIVLGTLLVCVPAFIVSQISGPVYHAQVTMMVNPRDSMLSSDLNSLMTSEQLAQTYSQLLKARPLLETVIASLGLDLSPEKLAEDMISIRLINNTQLIELIVKDADPQRASDIANEIAFTFISTHNAEQQLEGITELEQDVAAEMAELKAQIQQNRAAIERLRSSPSLLSEQELKDLQDTLAGQQSAYAGLLSTYLGIRQTQTKLLDVTIVEPATPPTEPAGPGSLLYAAVGGIAGLSLSIGLAVLLHRLNRSFETSDDVTRVLSLPTLGVIPWLSDRDRGSPLQTPDLHSAASEAYRTLRTNIRFASVDRPLKSVLVTSAEPNAGKTSAASNLGIVCAEAGMRAILVDADLRSPELHSLFDLDGNLGLTSLLIGDAQGVPQCVLETGIDNLRLLTSGPVPPNPSELLGSKRMEAILAQLEEIADLVILDSAPLLAVTDAAVLAPKVDGVILAVAAGRTSYEAAARACAALQQVNATVLGVVLVGAKSRDMVYFYYSRPARAAWYPTHLLEWAAKAQKSLRSLTVRRDAQGTLNK
jgi:succinoglycan biosynthesis transport protein ExoP